ncbi:MAG: alpha-amylase family glycosyl hydrolase, partial [Thermodesulfobacteriota bacterium]
TWGQAAPWGRAPLCLVPDGTFDWQGDRPLRLPWSETIIYELHVRGFTRHPSARVEHPGTYLGLVEKIPYLRRLGITAVELLPVFEFDENANPFQDPVSRQPLKDLWGYNPLAFFAPKAAYAADRAPGGAVREFKAMVLALHRAGIEVILDVVFNHTGHIAPRLPVLAPVDNRIHYLVDSASGAYRDLTGCGNTLACQQPVVRQLILDCLRYWVLEMHVDGFRFDLASIFYRGAQGQVLPASPLAEEIAADPLLAHTKIIAEPWDAAGLYQVGSFGGHPAWAEWNGRFRDDVRAFLCGQGNGAADLATRLAGSSDLYAVSGRRPTSSINFITCHDGFTLQDLVSYNRKHNQANGEGNRDGTDHNLSWNSGAEGPSRSHRVLRLRARRLKTLAAILFLAQGVPMFPAGDEFGRSQDGNNNPYCQDNPTGWVDWELAGRNRHLTRFFRLLIDLRHRHPVLRRQTFFPPQGEISWHGLAGPPNWAPYNRCLAAHLQGAASKPRDADFFFACNCDPRAQTFLLPPPPAGQIWTQLLDTAATPPADICRESEAEALGHERGLRVASMAAVLLISQSRRS